MTDLKLDKRAHAWSFAGTLDMAVFDASQGIGCGSSGGIVDSTELFTKLFRGRQDYQQSSLKSVRICCSTGVATSLSPGVPPGNPELFEVLRS